MKQRMWRVARRELTERLHDRAFILFNVAMLVILGVGGLVGLVLSREDRPRYEVAVYGPEASSLETALSATAPQAGIDLEVREVVGVREATAAVREQGVDAAVSADGRVLVEDRVDDRLAPLLQATQLRAALTAAAARGAISPSAADAIQQASGLSVQRVGTDDDVTPGEVVGIVTVPLLFISVYLYGYWISSSVVEEKSVRIVEILVSTVTPTELLAGKIIGVGVLGLGQLTILAAIGLCGALIAGVDLPPAAWGALLAALVWFVLGYVLYACAFAVAGALVSRQEDLQYTQIPVSLLIFAAFAIAFTQLADPDTAAARLLALVPPIAPLLMPLRIGFGVAALWEVVVAAALVVGTIVVLVRFAARVYAGSALRFGERIRLKEAMKGPRVRASPLGQGG